MTITVQRREVQRWRKDPFKVSEITDRSGVLNFSVSCTCSMLPAACSNNQSHSINFLRASISSCVGHSRTRTHILAAHTLRGKDLIVDWNHNRHLFSFFFHELLELLHTHTDKHNTGTHTSTRRHRNIDTTHTTYTYL